MLTEQNPGFTYMIAVMTAALYTRIFVVKCREWFFQTRLELQAAKRAAGFSEAVVDFLNNCGVR